MAYSEDFADRVRALIYERAEVTERKMFGGIAWMIKGNMAVGVMRDDGLLVRMPPDEVEQALAEEHVGPMDFTGRPMKGFVIVDQEGVASDAQLGGWIETGASLAESLPPK